MKKRKKKKLSPRMNLRFSPTAWAKLLYLRDYGSTEVGGFGVSAEDDLLYVRDVQLVQQTCSPAYVAFDDESVADFFDAQVDAGAIPAQFARIWLHTHPGDCPLPSYTDDETFERVFGGSDWALMFIIARGGRTYARLRFNTGPGGETEIPVEVDFSQPFSASNEDQWEQEYLENVQRQVMRVRHRGQSEIEPTIGAEFDDDDFLSGLPGYDDAPDDFYDYDPLDDVTREYLENFCL